MNESALTEARAALMVARVGAGLSEEEPPIAVTVGGTTFRSDPAELLAGHEKPLDCHPRYHPGELIVTCEPLKRDPQREHRRLDAYISIVERAQVARAGGTILLIGKGDQLLLSLEQMEQFTRDYDIRGAYLWAARPPARGERKRGIAWVISFMEGRVIPSV